MDNAFLGMNGFVWWVGVVEDNNDPLKIGRCRIRIFGWHTDDKSLIPTEDLPWSHAVLPINYSKCFSVPMKGDWVTGYFFDGKSGQFPAYFGVLPGVISQDNVKNPQVGFNDPSDTGAVTANVKQQTDGSGSIIQKNPFVSNPPESGVPTTNREAIHLEALPPISVEKKIIDRTVDIQGPLRKPLGTDLIAAATGGAAGAPKPTGSDGIPADECPCHLDGDSLLGQIGDLIPDATALLSQTESYITDQINYLQNEISGVVDSATSAVGDVINSATSVVNGAISEIKDAFDSMLSDATSEVMKQLEEAEEFAKKQLDDAESSLKNTIDDLSSQSGSVGCTILDGLKGLSPTEVQTVHPVIIENKTSKVVIGKSQIPSTVSVPNEIAPAVPVAQAPGSQIKSKENTISIWKQEVVWYHDHLIDAKKTIAAGGSYSSSSWSVIVDGFNKTYDKAGLIASTYNEPSLEQELLAWRKPFSDEVKIPLNEM